ncbi:MAG: HAD family hydrolase [Bacteroidetes bacterium]|nr:HAD family hydrolase [Bacteroidota bacterium]
MQKTSARQFEKAVLLDRDGIINHDLGDYTTSLSEFDVLPGTIETLKKWFDAGYGLVVITNQGGLEKDLYNESAVIAMHLYLQGLCNLQGFAIDAFYYCVHHPDYSGKCLCRKPGSLMVEKALHKFNLKPENCVMIGDRARDVQAAEGAGVKGIKIDANTGLYQVIL